MTTWYRLDLGNGVDAAAPTARIQKAFTAQIIAHGLPRPGFALFSRYDLGADNVELFFTPGAKLLAEQFGATPCEKPTHTRDSLGLLCGEGDALSVHFPDHPRYVR